MDFINRTTFNEYHVIIYCRQSAECSNYKVLSTYIVLNFKYCLVIDSIAIML